MAPVAGGVRERGRTFVYAKTANGSCQGCGAGAAQREPGGDDGLKDGDEVAMANPDQAQEKKDSQGNAAKGVGK